MTPPDTPVALDELLAHREWVRGLAFALTRDEHDAADVEQATWLAAVRHPPVHRRSLQGWLGTAVRRAAGKLRRSRARRRATEEALVPAAAGSVADDAADLAERADLHRRVVQALVALDEPYRATLLLRFFEGLPIAEVAARSGVPLETARARLRRGIAKLRERMESEYGGREGWFGAAALLVGRERPAAPAGAAAAAAGGVAMAAKTWAVAAAVVALGGVALWTATRGPERTVVVARTATVVAPPAEPSRPVARPQPPRAAPAPVETPDPTPADATAAKPTTEAPPATPKRSVAARLDETILTVAWEMTTVDRALAEVALRAEVDVRVPRALLEGPPKKLSMNVQETPARRLLEFLARICSSEVRVEDEFVALVPAGSSATASLDLVSVPSAATLTEVTVDVRVVDSSGAPVANASVRRSLDHAEVAVTDSAGRARWKGVPPLPRLHAVAPGHLDSPAALLEPGRETTITMAGRAAHLRIAVKDANGRPAIGASVFARPASETTGHGGRTGDDGRWEDASCRPGLVRIVVRAAGHATAERDVAARADTAIDEEITLVPEAVVVGIVRADQGRIIAGAQIRASRVDAPDDATSEATGTRQDGGYRLENLGAGKWRIVIEHPGMSRWERVVEVKSGESATVDVELTAK